MSSTPRSRPVARTRSSRRPSRSSSWSRLGRGRCHQRSAGRPQLLPAGSRDGPGPRDPRPLHDRLHHRGGHLLRRRGADRLDGHPLPAPAGRRRAAAADPRQQPRRGRLDGRPDDHRRCSCSSSRGRRSTASTPRADQPDIQVRADRRPVPVEVRVPRRRRRDQGRQPARRAATTRRRAAAGWSCRSGGRSTSPSTAPTSSTRSTSRSSCSSATSCRARSTVRVHRRRGRGRPDLPRPVRRAVRHRPPDDAVRRHRPRPGRLRRLAGRRSSPRANAHPRAAPERARRPAT